MESCCFLCTKKSSLNCDACHLPACCEAHLNIHNPEEERSCLPIQVRKSGSNYGRFLVAKEAFSKGEEVFQDSPVAFGPWKDEACLGCLKSFATDAFFYCHCGFSMCSETCSRSGGHLEECELLGKLFRDASANEKALRYPVVTILRMILAEKRDKDAFSHLMAEKVNRKFHILKKMLQLFARNQIGDEETICRLVGVRTANSKSLSKSGLKGSIAIYPRFSLMNHECSPNTVAEIDPSSLRMVVRAVKDIESGQEMTTSYLSRIERQPKRRLVIWRSWRFVCECKVCEKTLDDAVKCEFCDKGFMYPRRPNVPGTPWTCGDCGKEISEVAVVESIGWQEDAANNNNRW